MKGTNEMNKDIDKIIKKNKNVIVLIALLVVILVCALIISAFKQDRTDHSSIISEDSQGSVTYQREEPKEAEVSEIEAGELPSAEELGALGLNGVIQSKSITEQFNLSRYDEMDGGIRYSYLANKVTSGERLYVYAKAMSEEEYDAMLPTVNIKTGSIGDIDTVYNDRGLYYTSEDAEISESTKRSEEEGNIVIRYGNSTTEILTMQQLMWYKDGIGYTLESINRQYTIEDMTRLAEALIDSAE